MIRSGIALTVCLVMAVASAACGDQEQSSPGTSGTANDEPQGTPEENEAEPSPLAAVCEKAFALIEESEPGTVSRKKAVALANEAFFIDDSPETNEAFSNLNNVYVYDDGSSSPEEVRSQLEVACP